MSMAQNTAQSVAIRNATLEPTKIVEIKVKIIYHEYRTRNKSKNVIEQIRPYLQADGGDIAFDHLSDDNIVLC